MKQPHSIQLNILKKLLFAPYLKYSEMKPAQEMENNQFNFHLDQLIDSGYILKLGNQYTLSSAGKEYANRIDTDTTKVIRQAKVGVLIFSTKQIDQKTHYLVYTRLKQPFYGTQGLISGKVRYGEQITETAEREMEEECGLQGKAEIIGCKHYLVYEKTTSQLVEDKVLFICKITEPQGQLRNSEEGQYHWIAQDQMDAFMTNPIEEGWKQKWQVYNDYSGKQIIEEVVDYISNF